MHFLQTIFIVWQRELIRYWRDRMRIITTLFQPLMFLVIFGSGLRQTLAQGNFGIDFMQFMYPGIIGMGVMGVAFFSTISTVWDREFGFLREMMVAPVSRTAIVIGKTFGAMTISSSQGIVLLIIAPLVHLKLSFIDIPLLLLFMLLLSFSITGIGLLISSLMKSTESFGLIMQVLVFPMFFLSGAFFPLTNVPGWMSVLAKINPLSYGVDALRRIILDTGMPTEMVDKLALHSLGENAAFLIVFGCILLFFAVRAFHKKD